MSKRRGNELVDLEAFRKRVEKASDYMKQNRLEELAGIKNGGLSRIYGAVDALTVDHLIKLSAACNCSIDYLLGNDTRPKGSRPELTGADFIETIDKAVNAGSVTIGTEEWTDTSFVALGGPTKVNVNTAVIRTTNTNLSVALKNYWDLKCAIRNIDKETRDNIYSLWIEKEREKSYSIKGHNVADQQIEMERYGY